MIDLGVVFSVIIGGVLTLLGTLLANYLQYRAEERKTRKEIAKERLAEVRRYVITCLEFVDLISIPTSMGPELFNHNSSTEWIENITEHLEKWKSLPASGSARVLYTNDSELLEELSKIDLIRTVFYFNYLSMIRGEGMFKLDEKREELKALAQTVGKRLDKILETI